MDERSKLAKAVRFSIAYSITVMAIMRPYQKKMHRSEFSHIKNTKVYKV